MADIRIQAGELGDAINRELELYSRQVTESVNKAGQKAIKELERITKDTAPFDEKVYRRHYVESIATKTEDSRTGDQKHIWYVKPPNHRLTHLLVKGHETRDGGRTRADPFLKNALKRVLPKYEKDVQEAVKNGK